MLDSEFALLDRVRIFLLERDESFLGWQSWYEEAWILASDSQSEKVKITVASLDLDDFRHARVVLEAKLL